MHQIRNIFIGLTAAITSAPALAQQATNFDGDILLSTLLRDLPLTLNTDHSSFERLSLESLSEMRAAGFDPTWINDRFELPGFDASMHRTTQNDHPISIESWATHYTDNPDMQISDSLSFSVGRTTELNDGNISGSDGALPNSSGRDHVASHTQSEGEYDVYDLSLKWDAVEAGPVTISLLSGFKAIEAHIAKRVTKGNDTTIQSAHRVAAVPMIGSGFRWEINDALSFSGAAMTHPVNAGDTLIDFNASTDLRISSNVGFSAGYRIHRSSFEVGSVNTGIDQEGLFARLQIRF